MSSAERRDIAALIIVILMYLALPLLLLSLVFVTYLAISSLFKLAKFGFWSGLEFVIYLLLSVGFFCLVLLMARWYKRKDTSLFP